MTDQIGIYNLALVALGSDVAMDPDGDEERERILSAVFDAVLEQTLRDHPWNCAMVRTTLAADGDTPAYGFNYQYTLPAGGGTLPKCLRVISVADDPERLFKVFGRKLHTDAGAPLKIEYVKLVTNLEELDALCADAVAKRLAATVAYRLTQSRTKEEMAWKLYRDARRDAKAVDGQEGAAPAPFPDEFLIARR